MLETVATRVHFHLKFTRAISLTNVRPFNLDVRFSVQPVPYINGHIININTGWAITSTAARNESATNLLFCVPTSIENCKW